MKRQTVFGIALVLALSPVTVYAIEKYQPIAYYGVNNELVCVLSSSRKEISKVFKVVAKTAYSQVCPDGKK